MGEAYLRLHPSVAEDWARELGLSRGHFVRWVRFLCALHDTGKFAGGFQDQAREVRLRLTGPRDPLPKADHKEWGVALMRDVIRPALARRWARPGWDESDLRDLVGAWSQPFMAHHGAPVRKSERARDIWDAEGIAAAEAFVDDLIDLLEVEPPIPNPVPIDVDDAVRAVTAMSWRLAGFAVLCDWIGSQEDPFQRLESGIPLSEYWQRAQRLADVALREAHVLPARARPPGSTRDTFGFEPRPSQRLVEKSVRVTEPTLFILEDLTGSGKTEAAILLASRILAGTGAHGVFFGLPTMATANAMHARMGKDSGALFESGAAAEVTLAHARASQQARRARADPGDKGTIEAIRWLQESPKRALLADAAVATLDQALLGVLPVKHQALRLFALSSKVLIVDEVHAYDDYMTRLLETLLEVHAAAGGSAILLSATMPRALRQRLAAAFARGLGTRLPGARQGAYPLLTRLDATHGLVEDEVPASPEAAREIGVRFLDAEDQAEAVLRRAHAEGRSCCWIRNSVDDALDARERLRDLGPILFHARFLPDDRKRIEDIVRERAGPRSTPAQRRGLLVIATQVVEQSLDLDFDEMVTDLAPIDLVIQRSGRLRRHARGPEGAPGAVEARGPPTLHVLAPAWADDPDKTWFALAFPRARHVYPAHDKLWLTMDALRREGGLRLPARARALVEAAYGEDAEARTPPGLAGIREAVKAETQKDRSQAIVNALNFGEGYGASSGAWYADARPPTRLGEPTRRLYLARTEGDGICPLQTRVWDDTYVTVRASRVAPGPANQHIPDEGAWDATAVLREVEPGVWSGEARDPHGRCLRLRYDATFGLRFEKEE